jgi:hypothetical protein
MRPPMEQGQHASDGKPLSNLESPVEPHLQLEDEVSSGGCDTMKKYTALAALLACFGCQKYVVLDRTPPALGSDVRVSLNDDAAAISFARIGSRVHLAEGKLLGATDSTLALGVTGVTRANGLEDGWSGDTVVFRRSEIAGVEQRRVSTSRTLLSLGAFVVGGIIAHAGLKGGESTVVGGPKPSGGN